MLDLTITIADYAPVKAVLDIVLDMARDDRVPIEYKMRICKALFDGFEMKTDDE